MENDLHAGNIDFILGIPEGSSVLGPVYYGLRSQIEEILSFSPQINLGQINLRADTQNWIIAVENRQGLRFFMI